MYSFNNRVVVTSGCRAAAAQRIKEAFKSSKKSWINLFYFRLRSYTVISLPSSVIYFGGQSYYEGEYVTTDRVAEYKNLEWKLLGNLVSPRIWHSSIKMGTSVYTFGGRDDDWNEIK